MARLKYIFQGWQRVFACGADTINLSEVISARASGTGQKSCVLLSQLKNMAQSEEEEFIIFCLFPASQQKHMLKSIRLISKLQSIIFLVQINFAVLFL